MPDSQLREHSLNPICSCFKAWAISFSAFTQLYKWVLGYRQRSSWCRNEREHFCQVVKCKAPTNNQGKPEKELYFFKSSKNQGILFFWNAANPVKPLHLPFTFAAPFTMFDDMFFPGLQHHEQQKEAPPLAPPLYMSSDDMSHATLAPTQEQMETTDNTKLTYRQQDMSPLTVDTNSTYVSRCTDAVKIIGVLNLNKIILTLSHSHFWKRNLHFRRWLKLSVNDLQLSTKSTTMAQNPYNSSQFFHVKGWIKLGHAIVIFKNSGGKTMKNLTQNSLRWNETPHRAVSSICLRCSLFNIVWCLPSQSTVLSHSSKVNVYLCRFISCFQSSEVLSSPPSLIDEKDNSVSGDQSIGGNTLSPSSNVCDQIASLTTEDVVSWCDNHSPLPLFLFRPVYLSCGCRQVSKLIVFLLWRQNGEDLAEISWLIIKTKVTLFTRWQNWLCYYGAAEQVFFQTRSNAN